MKPALLLILLCSCTQPDDLTNLPRHIDTNAPGYMDYISVGSNGSVTFGPAASRNALGITNGRTNTIGNRQ